MSESFRNFIGTSGWHYKHWRNVFYPIDLPEKDFLSYYSQKFKTVEINNSFYRLPEAQTFAQWREQTPEGFLFAIKSNRYITHMKKLKDPISPLKKMFDAAASLEPKSGPFLFQMPPRWKKNTTRLEEFLRSLPDEYRYTFEFRDEDWFADDIYNALSEKGAAFCIYDLNGCLSPLIVTTDFVYIRLHGPGGPYQGMYSNQELDEWESRIRQWNRAGKDVYCYFDNDQNGYAVTNADILQNMLMSPVRENLLSGTGK